MTDESNLEVTCAAVEWISPKVDEPRRCPISQKVFCNRPHCWLSRRDSKGFMSSRRTNAPDRSCRRGASGARPPWNNTCQWGLNGVSSIRFTSSSISRTPSSEPEEDGDRPGLASRLAEGKRQRAARSPRSAAASRCRRNLESRHWPRQAGHGWEGNVNGAVLTD
jgi:hypothetical protein